jgi:hypothetical protein
MLVETRYQVLKGEISVLAQVDDGQSHGSGKHCPIIIGLHR